MAWDRPLVLNHPLSKGGRAQAFGSISAPGALPEGRLGGGGANAAAALVNAGHRATVASAVPQGATGDKVLAAAEDLGIDTRFARRVPLGNSSTLILIEPDGERVVLQLMDREIGTTGKLEAMMDAFAAATAHAWGEDRYSAIFHRAGRVAPELNLLDFQGIILAQGPLAGATPSDYVVASQDDIERAGLTAGDMWERTRTLAAERLKALIITDGPRGGSAITASGTVPYTTPQVKQRDSTGAGDCFAAGFLEAITSGADLLAALNHGALWGAQTAARMGSALGCNEQIYRPYQPRNTEN